MLREVAQAAGDHLRAEIASAEGRHDEALKLQTQAVAASAKADDNEPPMLAAGARLALGDLQLRAGRAAQAEATYREDLAALPNSGWALAGLSRALQAQGKTAEAVRLKPQLDAAWALADANLKTTR
jgi:tetratricopeptide (TPR) repeat protein